jgi:hypothetical protein
MSIDICVASKDYGENIKTGSFQPSLWLSTAIEIDKAMQMSTDMSQVGVTLFSPL